MLFPLIPVIVLIAVMCALGSSEKEERLFGPRRRRIKTPAERDVPPKQSPPPYHNYYDTSSAKAFSKSDIVERAKQNTEKYKPDRALNEMEETHAHKETVSSTNVKLQSAKYKAEHPKNAEHVNTILTEEERNNLKHIKDLMATGYDGSLSFERDFVSEGQDMINRFLYQDIF